MIKTKVTAKIIAEQLGLSIATVDRALNKRGNVKEETYQKIMQKAKELNYKPNKLASFLSRKEQFTIAIVFPEYPVYFWEQVEKGITKAFNELNDYGLDVKVFKIPDQDLTRGREIIQHIIDSEKVDALSIAIGDDPFVELIDYGIVNNLKICTFNHDSPASRRMFYVGSDYRKIGRLAAELTSKFIGEKGEIALITSTDTTYQAQEKIAGFREVLKEYPNVEMVGPFKIDRLNVNHSMDLIKNSLDGLAGIYVANAELSSIARYIEKLEGKRVLIGNDINKEINEYIKKGIITATINQDPVNQGYLAVKKLFEHLTEEEYINNKELITKLEIITKENAQFYI